MNLELIDLYNQNFQACSPFFRDTNLTDFVFEKYKIGIFLREPTFCDATYKPGGFGASHRYLIISSNARCLDDLAPQPWGLCVWQRNRVFKILDVLGNNRNFQITLLEIPEELVTFFSNNELSELETTFIQQARDTFEQACKLAPLPELNTNQWKDRLVYPIGISDSGDYFPLYDIDSLEPTDNRETIASVLNYQASVNLRAGDFSEAHQLLQQAIEVLPDDGLQIIRAESCLLLGQLYLEISDYQKTEAFLHEAFSLYQTIGENRKEIAITTNLLAHLYHTLGSFDSAERFYLHSLKINRRVQGEMSSSVAMTLSSMGALYEMWGRYEDSEKCLSEARQIGKDLFGEKGAKYSVILNNSARLAQKTGKYDDCLKYLLKALAIIREIPAAPFRDHGNLLYNIAEVYVVLGQPLTSLSYMKEALFLDNRVISEVSSFGSERQRIQTLEGLRFRLDQLVSLVSRYLPHSEEAIRTCANFVLQRKALSADALAIRRDVILSGRYPHLREQIQELSRLRTRISDFLLAASSGGEGEELQTQLENDLASREHLEAELSRQIPEISLEALLKSTQSSSLLRAIPTGAVVLDFIRVHLFDFEANQNPESSKRQEYHYLVLIMSPEAVRKISFIDLGDANDIDGMIAEFRFTITGEAETRNLIPSPVLEKEPDNLEEVNQPDKEDVGVRLWHALVEPLVPYIGDSQRLFISPDGNLSRLPFEVLPTGHGRRLIDIYQVSYLSASRDLLRFNLETTREPSEPLVMACPDFDLGQRKAGEKRATHRSDEIYFGPIPETRAEGEAIAGMLGVRPLLESEALESTLKSKRSPRILHLATHGFVLKFEKPKPLSPDEIEVGMELKPADTDREMIALDGILATPMAFVDASKKREFARLSGDRLENPLLRSGLALAGANTWLSGGAVLPQAEDGILTAEDVTGLDLIDTDLVVLSACETGLGEIKTGEGVFGLRRSFVLAGAKTLVMSLWKVPDEQTKELMLDFYRRLLDGEPRASALRNAQLTIRKTYPDPFYWGAFIAQGNPEPLTPPKAN